MGRNFNANHLMLMRIVKVAKVILYPTQINFSKSINIISSIKIFSPFLFFSILHFFLMENGNDVRYVF